MKSTLLKDNIPFQKWSFVDQHGRDDDHWYIRLTGGEYDEVIYRSNLGWDLNGWGASSKAGLSMPKWQLVHLSTLGTDAKLTSYLTTSIVSLLSSGDWENNDKRAMKKK